MAQESAYFTVNKLVGLHDTKNLKKRLDALPGVNSVSISEASNRVAVDFDNTGVTPAQIQQKIELLGYPVEHTGQGRVF